jgi:hypothetical protein
MTMIKAIFAMVVIVLISAAAFIYSGLYPMGADNQHNKITYWALETMRENSIARSARGIEVPELGDPSLLLMGGLITTICAQLAISSRVLAKMT